MLLISFVICALSAESLSSMFYNATLDGISTKFKLDKEATQHMTKKQAKKLNGFQEMTPDDQENEIKNMYEDIQRRKVKCKVYEVEWYITKYKNDMTYIKDKYDSGVTDKETFENEKVDLINELKTASKKISACRKFLYDIGHFKLITDHYCTEIQQITKDDGSDIEIPYEIMGYIQNTEEMFRNLEEDLKTLSVYSKELNGLLNIGNLLS
ncbi:hypothetical protein ECANGB1_1627 [Enterospora canceri]|uniref:Uncharacterized protein n=1 Tax=Enterospora canceri TaxID=1081671 RepID=A0A1Y1S5N8_9MICR|nr:hypothetical protein ECANGB1_1627 [Enterospora canceri]